MYSITEGFSSILYCRPDVVTLGNPYGTMKRFCLYSQCSHLNFWTRFHLRWMLRRFRCVQIFLKHNKITRFYPSCTCCMVWFIMKEVAWYGLLCLIVISLLGCVWSIFNVQRKIRTRLDLLSIPQSGGGNVKTFRWDQRLQIQNLFHGI